MGVKFYSVIFIVMMMMGISSCGNYRKFKNDREALLVTKEQRKADKKADKEAKKQSKKDKQVDAVEDNLLTQANDSLQLDSIVPVKEVGDSLYMSYERTGCFGRCPIYKIRIFDSGFATYEGINFVPRMGMYHTRMDEAKLIEIETKLADMYFFELEDSYNNDKITDLPSKIVVVNKPNNKKRIVARYEVPQSLISLFELMDQTIDGIDWQPGD